MSNLLFSLAAGVVLITLGNILLFRFSSLGAKYSALVTALATVGIYVPLAILSWPGADVVAIHLAIYLVCSVAFGLIMSSREQGTAEGNRGGGSLHWGPLAIIGFFICLFAVDSVFVMMAERGIPSRLMAELLPDAQHARVVSSVFPGVVSHNFQKQEDLYNQYLLQVEQQQQRGWQVRKGWLTKPVLKEPTIFQVIANTREGVPIYEAEITGRFLRPSNSRLDKGFSMREVEPGVYQASVTLPAAGTWDLVMQVRKGHDLHEVRARTLVSAP